MAGIPPAVDDDLQELIDELMKVGPEEEAEDREHEEISATVLSLAREYLEDPDPPSPEQAEWAAGTEIAAQSAANTMASCVLDLRRGLAVFAGTGRPEEEMFRKHAAWADARRAEAVEIVSAARRLQEKELRWLAARDHPVYPEVAGLITAMREVTKSRVLGSGNVVHRAELLAAAIKFEDAVVEKMTALKEKLTRGAAAFAGEEELVRALQKHAATAEAEIAEAQAFSAALSVHSDRAASLVVRKRPAPETEEEPPRQRRRTSLAGHHAGDCAAQD